MQIFLGYDHGAFHIRDALLSHLRGKGHEVVDMGLPRLDPMDDYPDFAWKVGQAVLRHPGSRGILLCRSGGGVCIAANKIKGIRAGFAGTIMQAKESIAADDANILCLGADAHHLMDLQAMMDTYLAHSFEGGRHERRKNKVEAIENGTFSLS